jgi:RNase adaptor protein for sRNA GlmZ degradation
MTDVDVDEECDSLQSSSDSLEPLNNHSNYEDLDGVLRITFVSFGHKFGVDSTADKIFNIRSYACLRDSRTC